MKTVMYFLILVLFEYSIYAQCFESISVGYQHNLIIKTDGTIWSWGSNQSGELGINSGIQNVFSPKLINFSTDWQSIFAGSRTSFAIKSNGTLWAWGDGIGGKLGFGNQNSVYLPTQLGSNTDWEYVTSGTHTIAKKTNGTLWGWGSNIYGQLNLGTNSIELNPVQISSETNWTKIVAGGFHTLAIKDDGTLWACGLNDFGQLGDGTTTNKLNFVQIGNDNDWIEIDAGEKHSMALKSNGTIFGWGQNHVPFLNYYIFGDNFPSQIFTPTLLNTDNDWTDISCNGYLLCLKANGTAWIFNDNTTQLINNDNDWNSIYSGNSHLFIKKQDGTLWGFGDNTRGQLGLGNNIQNTTIPTQLNCSTLTVEDIIIQDGLSVYPNPTKDLLFINNNKDIPIDSIKISDLTGKVVFKKNNITEIDLKDLVSGVYIVSIFSKNKLSVFKVIKN